MGIRKLARELELSIGTVSRALNGRPDVSEATRERVKAAAAASGYVANQSGRSLRKGCTGIVAAVIPTATFSATAQPVFFSVLEGTRRSLFAAGLDLVVLFRGPEEDALDNLARIVSRRVADAIIITQTSPADPRIGLLARADIEFVAFGRSAGCDGFAWVDLDFEGATAEAVRLLRAAGHQRIALVTNELPLNYNMLMRNAFDSEAARAGYGQGARRILTAQGVRLAEPDRAALSDPREAPTGYLAGNEAIAAGLYADLAVAGRPVGGGSAVICLTTVIDPLAFVPALTSFDTDLDAVGRLLAEHLLAALPGVDRRHTPVSAVVPARFAGRGSHVFDGAAAQDAPAVARQR